MSTKYALHFSWGQLMSKSSVDPKTTVTIPGWVIHRAKIFGRDAFGHYFKDGKYAAVSPTQFIVIFERFDEARPEKGKKGGWMLMRPNGALGRTVYGFADPLAAIAFATAWLKLRAHNADKTARRREAFVAKKKRAREEYLEALRKLAEARRSRVP